MSTKVVVLSLLVLPIFGMDIRFPRDTNETNILTFFTTILSRTRGNVSMVAWENIYDSDGNIVQVESLRLVFPGKDIESKGTFYDGFTSRDDQHKTIKDLEPSKRFQEQGRGLIDVFVERPSDDGMLFYWNPTTTYFRLGGLVTFNKTVTTTQEEVDKFLAKEAEHKHLLPLLKAEFDDGGKIKLEKSDLSVSPTVTTYVASSWEAPDRVLLDAPVELQKVFLTHEYADIPKALVEKLEEKFPEYEWGVLVNPGEFQLNEDFWIRLGLDGFSFYEPADEYLAYAVKK